MASSNNICYENLVGLADIDIDMEVKSEHDFEEENNCGGCSCNGSDELNLEFIIPEQRKPEDSETEINTICTDSQPLTFETDGDSGDSDMNSDEEVEDEPEVSCYSKEIIPLFLIIVVCYPSMSIQEKWH